ncbi:MAG: FHA domain-containing protein [Bdellovibrionales bacterium]|nr:FHA domain-containing protein [Bdellovibrionales bacterium]
MFALEITFQDGAVESETVFVQRPHAIIGSSEYSHVVIGDLSSLPFDLHLFRGVGRKFRVLPIAKDGGSYDSLPSDIEGEFENLGKIQLGPVELSISVIDSDLVVPMNEPLDKVAVRILRRAASRPRPQFPAVAQGGDNPVALSFAPDDSVLIGRDRECTFRLDSPDVSGKHARLIFENDRFVIEDLGSTNGTYVNGQQVSGRTIVPSGQPIIIGRSVVIYGIEGAAVATPRRSVAERELQTVPEEKYPMLISYSEVARPPRLILRGGATVRIGREPSSDLWLGAPHVSRKHCTIEANEAGSVIITDLSRNGLAYDGGVLTQGESVQLGERPTVLNFGGGITVAVCLSAHDEQVFSEAGGSPTSFIEDRGTLGHERKYSRKPYTAQRKNAAHRLFIGATVVRFFKRLSLIQRIGFMFALFIVVLAVSLALKLLAPMFVIPK